MASFPPRIVGRAADWFLLSGIQDARGGVSRYFRGDTGERLPNSTEITGYAAGGLLYLEQPEAAIRAADFLLAAWDGNLRLIPFELNGAVRFAYFFDSGIIARGWLAVWRRTGREEYLDAALRAGNSMIEHFTAAEGYHPILELPSCTPLAYGPWWSRNPGAFQLKAALAWRELAEITGESRFEEHYQRQLAFSRQSIRRLIDSEPDRLKVMDRLHPYCYFLEGLLPDAASLAEPLAAGIAEVGRRLRELRSDFVRSDVYAQLLRVRLLADQAGAVPLDHPAAAEEAADLTGFLLESPDPRLDGAFAFGARAGQIIPHANPVSTIFGVQALGWWNSGQPASVSKSWRDLL